MSRAPAIVCLTDFGARDWYAGTLKGVLAARAPGIPLIDLTHEIPPQDVRAGAIVLAAAAPWFPRGTVFLAVVDPGVGTGRALLAAHAGGRFFVGPDNGLLSLALAPHRKRAIVRLTRAEYWQPEISRTFHGRDILAPVAAHLAKGGALRALGPSALPQAAPLWPPVQPWRDGWRGNIIHIDAFGNLLTNLPAPPFNMAQGGVPSRSRGAPRGGRAVVRFRGHRVPMVSSYAAGSPRQLVAVVNSLGLVELAIRNGSAVGRFRARRGEPVALDVSC